MTFAPLKKSLFVSLVALLVLLVVSPRVMAQDSHCKWSFSTNKISECEYELVFTAQIDNGWHLYSQKPGKALPGGEGETGPTPTLFAFDKKKTYQLVGKTSEPGGHADDAWKELGLEVMAFEKSAVFKQKIKLLTDKEVVITGTIDGMVCSNGSCIPFLPNPTFKFTVTGTAACGSVTEPVKDTVKQADTIGAVSGNASGSGSCDCKAEINEAIANAMKKGGHEIVDTTGCRPVLLKASDTKLEPVDGGEEITAEDNSLWGIFLGGFIGGLLALLTPCVFPMIPMTVSFFTKRSKDRASGIRNAITYALAIIMIYVTIGMLITIIFGPAALNDMASSAFFNILFFVVFIVFAISFFGAFEITLPSRFVNKVDAASDRGGLLGILFMAFTLSLVSFSCTGPIIGSLIVLAAAEGSFLAPAIGMFGFALALALPFALFALFPGWLNSLPKSGGWLNSVKVVLAFIELALALKFLSNVDLAYHWEFLTREVFLAIWIIIAILLGFYLLGKLKFSHDSDLKFVSIPRLLFAVFAFGFAIYMVPGIWGAPTNLISGLLPPSYYKEWKEPNSSDCPHDLSCFHNFEEGMCYARKVGKPVLIDFTGYACVNCRKMEDFVWPKPEVYKLISEKYVLISLYVDDKKELPEKLKFTTPEGEAVKTFGRKWSVLEQKYYGQISQPLYVLVDNSGKILAKPRGYTPDAGEYVRFLETGLKRYELRKEGVAEESK